MSERDQGRRQADIRKRVLLPLIGGMVLLVLREKRTVWRGRMIGVYLLTGRNKQKPWRNRLSLRLVRGILSGPVFLYASSYLSGGREATQRPYRAIRGMNSNEV